ncbi:hypothetical protein AB0F72_19360 [Actinoplanes sp. NPDC023936]|uniref:hypothetical protein n=1 Tax=Actinoplanes sp. NPDC023936 TaxID=3154910 RepID=UPI0033FB5291
MTPGIAKQHTIGILRAHRGAAVAIKEGREAWRGDICCASRSVAATTAGTVQNCDDGCCTNERSRPAAK